MTCKGLCNPVKHQFKHVSGKRKIFNYFSCNTCYLFFNISELNTLYENHPELQTIIKNHRGGEKGFIMFLKKRNNNCFCCGRRFSVRSRGSYQKRKRDLLEQLGKIKRIE